MTIFGLARRKGITIDEAIKLVRQVTGKDFLCRYDVQIPHSILSKISISTTQKDTAFLTMTRAEGQSLVRINRKEIKSYKKGKEERKEHKKREDDIRQIQQEKKRKEREKLEIQKKLEFNQLQIGTIVDAEVNKIGNSHILVQFGSLFGTIDKSELYYSEIRRIDQYLYPGKPIKAKVLSKEQIDSKLKIKLSYKACYPNIWDTIEIAQGEWIDEAMYAAVVDNGVYMSIAEGLEGFIPASEISRREFGFFKEGDVDQTVPVCVKDFDRKKRKLILSRRPIYEVCWEDFDDKFCLEKAYPAKILEIEDDCIWADLDEDLDVRIPKKELYWDRTSMNEKQFKVGQRIHVVLTAIDEEKQSISGSIRKLIPNPWDVAAATLSLGSIIEVKLREIDDKYIHVETIDGNHLLGRIRLSEVSWTDPLEQVKDKLPSIGSVLKAKIVVWKPEKACLELSIRQQVEDPWKSIPLGAEVEGIITKKRENDCLVVKLPNGLKAYTTEVNLSSHVNESLPFKVVESNRYQNRIVVNHQRLKQDRVLDKIVQDFFS